MTDSESKNASKSEPKDAKIRHEVVQAEASFVVSAPAGSGKTGLLTCRVLKLLCVVAQPEEILAITFTRKAAAEMHERIFRYLEIAQSVQADASLYPALSAYDQALTDIAAQVLERSQHLDWQLLTYPDRLNISTIDGFCKSLCNQLPFFSGLGAQTSVLENAQHEYELVARRWCIAALAKSEPSLEKLLAHFSGNIERLISLLANLLGKRDQWLAMVSLSQANAVSDQAQLREYFINTLKDWLTTEIRGVADYVKIYEGELLQIIRFAYENRSDARDPERLSRLAAFDSLPITEPGAVQFWSDFAHLCLTNKQTFRSSLTKKDGFPSPDNKDEKARAKHFKQRMLAIFVELQASGLDLDGFAGLLHMPVDAYQHDSWAILADLLPVLIELTAHLKVRFAELRQADFTEFSLGAVQALNNEYGNIDLQQRFDYSIQHILIDEFQDTSHTQLELLRALTREWQPDDGRSLFLVGDGMQSCYSFRNANVGIFLGMQEQGLPNINLKQRELEVNFRSSSHIVNWVNLAFEHAFPQQNNRNMGAVSYVPSSAAKPADEHSYVRCHSFDYDSDGETQWLVEEIRRIQSAYPNQSIAVLTRSRSHVQNIIQALAQEGIDYSAIDFDPLLSKQHIIDLHAIARCLYDDSDSLALLALLRAPIAALNHNNLSHLFQPVSINQAKSTHADTTEEEASKETPLLSSLLLLERALQNPDIDTESKARIQRLYQVIADTKAQMYRRSFAELLELTWLGLGGPESLHNSVEIEDIRRYLALLKHHEQGNVLEDWSTFETVLHKEYARPLAKTDQPVQIMTIHKSKGLEFDTIFLPCLHKQKQKTESEILYWMENIEADMHSRFILSPINAKQSREKDQVTEYIKHTQKRKASFEDTRIFYVACTRAKQRLYLSAELKVDNDGEGNRGGIVRPNGKASYLSKIWPVIEEQLQHHPQNASAELDKKAYSAAYIHALPSDWSSALPKQHCDAANIFDNSDFNFLDSWQDHNSLERKIGIVTHQLIQLIAQHGLASLKALGRERVSEFIASSVISEGLSGTDFDTICRDLMLLYDALLDNSDFQWLVSGEHRSAHNEWNLWAAASSKFGNQNIRQHVIDRAFIDGDTRWIIDYKTASPKEGQAHNAFVAEQWQYHRDQLLRYREVVGAYDEARAKPPEKTKLALFFPALLLFSHKPEFDVERDTD